MAEWLSGRVVEWSTEWLGGRVSRWVARVHTRSPAELVLWKEVNGDTNMSLVVHIKEQCVQGDPLTFSVSNRLAAITDPHVIRCTLTVQLTHASLTASVIASVIARYLCLTSCFYQSQTHRPSTVRQSQAGRQAVLLTSCVFGSCHSKKQMVELVRLVKQVHALEAAAG